MKRRIQVGIADPTSAAKGFVEAWKRAEAGERVRAEERLDFENLEALLKTFTRARWVLLKTLWSAGPMRFRALSSELGRDYRDVHTDVWRLEEIGLVDRDKKGFVRVPWTTVAVRLEIAV